MPDQRLIDGDVCELICAEHFMRQGYWVFPAAQGSSPIDMIIVNAAGARLLQVKKNAGRVNPGRKGKARIHRPRSNVQKALGVEFVYVDIDSREVFVTNHDYHTRKKQPTVFDEAETLAK